MCEDADEGNDEDGVQVAPVVHQNIADEVDDWGGNDDEEDEHRNHFEEVVCQCVEQ